jgi:hypothetical protein
MPALDATQAARLSAGTLLLLPLLPPPLLLYGDDSTGESKAAVPALPRTVCANCSYVQRGRAASLPARTLAKVSATMCLSSRAVSFKLLVLTTSNVFWSSAIAASTCAVMTHANPTHAGAKQS